MSRGIGRSFGGKHSMGTKKAINTLSGVGIKAPRIKSASNYATKAKRSAVRGIFGK